METCLNYGESRRMYVSTDERIWINRILRLQEEHPEDIHIIKMPKDNNGCLYCWMPAEYLHLAPRTKHTLTDEQREALSNRLNEIRAQQRQ